MKSKVRRIARPLMIACLASTLLVGCDINIGDFGVNSNIVQGSGKVITEQRSVSEIAEVVFTMSGQLIIEQNGSEALTVEADDNIVPLIATDMTGNKLTITTRPNSGFHTTNQIVFRLSVKDLNSIRCSGSGDIKMASWNAANAKLEATGSGSMDMSGISTGSIAVSITGSGSISASGKATRQDVTLSGSGSYDARRLESASAKVGVSGSGSATVKVSDSLDASVSGSGSVLYIGGPTVIKKDTGSGQIVPIAP